MFTTIDNGLVLEKTTKEQRDKINSALGEIIKITIWTIEEAFNIVPRKNK